MDRGLPRNVAIASPTCAKVPSGYCDAQGGRSAVKRITQPAITRSDTDMANRKTTRRALATAAACMLTLGAAGIAQAQTKLDLSTVWPDSNFHTANAKRYAEEVGKATGGQVQIIVHAGGSLGFKGPEHLRAVRDGLVPMADILNNQQIGDEPLFGLESLPFLIGSQDDMRALQKHTRPIYEQVAARNNQKILYIVPWPTQYLHMKAKADSLEGLKGIKVRVPDRNAADMLNAAGMAGILIPWGETIPALASGAVAGVSTSSSSGVDGKFWEFLKYVYPTNHTWSSQLVTINLDAWKKLKPEHQKALEDVARRLEPEFWAVSLKNDTDSLDRLKQGGMEVVTLPAAMMTEFRARTAPLVDAYLKRVPQGEAAVRAYMAETRKTN
jgi:TRAP-type C4-dicarboxylate transport system substrate-binding protein